MKYPTHAILLGALAIGAFASGGARAASLSTLDHAGSVGYSAVTNDTITDSHLGDDLSAGGGVVLFGAADFGSTAPGQPLQHGYAADAYFGTSGNGAELYMSLSHALDSGAAGAYAATHQHDAFVDLSSITLRIDGTGGEALGSAVRVSFSGLASAPLYTVDSGLGGYLGMGLSVTQGDAVLGEFLWDVQAAGEQLAGFSFTGYVGQTYTLSGFLLSGVAGELAGTGPQSLAAMGGSLSGSFSVTPVPEAETYAMLLAGLGVLGVVARRRQRA